MKQLLATTALLLLATSAVAQTEPKPKPAPGRWGGMATFAEFDLNGDGVITQQEFNEARNKRIAARAAEGRPMRGLAQAEDFKAIDTNGDGRIDRQEFAAHQQRHWQNRPVRQ